MSRSLLLCFTRDSLRAVYEHTCDFTYGTRSDVALFPHETGRMTVDPPTIKRGKIHTFQKDNDTHMYRYRWCVSRTLCTWLWATNDLDRGRQHLTMLLRFWSLRARRDNSSGQEWATASCPFYSTVTATAGWRWGVESLYFRGGKTFSTAEATMASSMWQKGPEQEEMLECFSGPPRRRKINIL